MSKFACPCCGHLVLEARVCWDICAICYWEDDPVQIADPWFEGGANVPSLVQSQENYRRRGRKPKSDYQIDPDWRPVGPRDKDYATTPGKIEQKRENGEVVPYEYWLRNSD